MSNLQSTLNGKANASHTHTTGQISGLESYVKNLISQTGSSTWKYIEFTVPYLANKFNAGLNKMPLMAVISMTGGNSGIVRYIQFRIDDTTSIKLMLGTYPEDGIATARIDTAMAEPPYYIINMVSSSGGAGGVANILL